MITVPSGSFTMGSDHHYPEERPAHQVQVAGFRISRAPVTVAEFAAFVGATGWVTTAEHPLPAVPAGGAVFTPPDHPVDLADPSQWWSRVPGAQWRHPFGPGSEAAGDHPVTQVSHADAVAYCAWAGAALPTEDQWELAAQGASRDDATVWQGSFPHAPDGPVGTSAVGSHRPNPLGLLDAVGNVWEWTSTPWTGSHAPRCCAPAEDPLAPGVALQVAKGGSFLCSEQYCARYRPQARTAMAVDSPACHLGFRTASKPG